MKTRCTLIKQLTQSLICVLLSIGCYGPLAIGADFNISTQADFDTYRQATFSPGDNILFERGKVFTGMFSPTTVGTPGNVITISTYGSGAKPIINNNGVIHPHPTRGGEVVSAGLLLFNAEYVEVNNLEITNNNGGDQTEDLMGIYVLGEDQGKALEHIYLQDNYIHHVNGAVAGKMRGGIHVHGKSPDTPNATSYDDLRIVNNRIDQIGGVGIGTDISNADIEDANTFAGTNRPNAIKNLYVAHNWVGNTGRNAVIARDTDYALYEYNTIANSSRYSTGNSMFNFKTIGTIFQYNEAYGNVGDVGDHDRGGFDADYKSKGTIIQYNYSHGNHWFASIMKKPMTDTIIRYNLSVNDLYGSYHYGFENNTEMTGTKIYNNTHYFKSSLSPELIGPRLDRTPHETTFNNNIFYTEGSGTAGTNADNGTNVTYDTNVYYNITPPTTETNALSTDPLFVSPGAEPYDIDMEFGRDVLAGYMLSASSPYIDGGLTIANNGGLDFWGAPVPVGSTDIGAGEFAGGGTGPAVTIFTGNLFPEPSGAEVIVATPDGPNNKFGDDSTTSLSQTFQVDSAFDLRTIFLDYKYDPDSNPNSIVINIEIFEIADVGASTITPGSSLLTLTALSMPEIGTNEEAAIVLDSPLSLPATTGTAGYALRVTNGGNPGFEWLRTVSDPGSVYDFGQAYEDGDEKLSGERDFVLALSDASVGVPVNADFDGSGLVDGLDFLAWQREFGTTSGAQLSDGDADHDNDVDKDDLTVWENQYGSAAPLSAAAAVPEPSAALLAALFGIAAMGVGRFRQR